MARPGTTINRVETRPARSTRTGTGPWFIAGITGTVDADTGGVRKSVKSLTEYATRFGSRAAHADASMYDAAEFYFKDGGAELFVARTADAVDATLTAALGTFAKDLGPGQVSAPGRTVGTQHTIVMAHAEANNRIAILDGPNTANVATLTAANAPAGATANQKRTAALFAPFVTVPGVAGGTRNIAPSAIVAAAMSRNDGRGVTPNQPSAGDYGVSPSGLDVTFAYIEADRTTLNVNGVNLLRSINGVVKVYGYRTLASPADTTEANWLQLSNARLFMKLQAEYDAVGERFVFRQIDAQRLTINEYGGALSGVTLPYWQRGSLYGLTAEEAFRVDVGPNVNTDVSIANQELRANVALRTSPFAEEVILELVKTRITEAI